MNHGGGYDTPIKAFLGITQRRDPKAAEAALRMIAEGVSKNGKVPDVLRDYLSRAIHQALSRSTPESKADALISNLRLTSTKKTNTWTVAVWTMQKGNEHKRRKVTNPMTLAKDEAAAAFNISVSMVERCLAVYRKREALERRWVVEEDALEAALRASGAWKVLEEEEAADQERFKAKLRASGDLDALAWYEAQIQKFKDQDAG